MDINKTIPHLFEEHAQQFPKHIAATDGVAVLTYGELNQKANQLAWYLLEHGFESDTPIAVCLPRSFDFLIAILAILKAGGAYLPIDAAQPIERLFFLLNDSQAPILITQLVCKDKFNAYRGKLVLLDDYQEQIQKQNTSNAECTLNPANLAYVIYTSGSTGAPKGVLIEHHSVINYCQWFAEYTGCQKQERVDFSSNPIFDMAISVSLVPLMLGLTVVICDEDVKKNAALYLQHLANSEINLIKLTPSYFKVLLQEAKSHFIALPSLKSIVLGGENLTAFECQAWLELYSEQALFNEYGPTEATVAISVYKLNFENRSEFEVNVPIGRAGLNMNFLVVDEEHKIVNDGEAGELLIGGTCLARGYLNQQVLTQKQFLLDPFNTGTDVRFYKSGDLCRIRADGMLEYMGRLDDQIKIRGFRIEPGEIEKCLMTHPLIKTAAIVPQKNALQEHHLIAYYVLEESDALITERVMRELLHKHLPEYMIPTAFVKIESLPLTANGKLDKAALPQPRLKSTQPYLEPTTDIEKQITHLWSEELGVHLIGLNDNFFELGGHSLSAARLVSKINHQLEKNISLHDFYQATCIAKLITILQKQTVPAPDKIKLNEVKYNQMVNVPLNDFQFLLWIADTFEKSKIKNLNIVARKRFQGSINKEALDFAFAAVLKKHEVLLYQILKLQPMQQVRKNSDWQLIEQHFESLSEQECEKELNHSLIELSNFQGWSKHSPLILAKICYLENDMFELQIGMPHIIIDDASIEILFSDLSKFYCLYNKKYELNTIETDTHFKKYVFTERHILENSLDKNIAFWDDYFKDTSFFSFPKQYIIKDMKASNFAYSTYAELSKRTIHILKQFCEQNHISINNGLCAVLSLALRNCCGNHQHEIPFMLMNIIKSTRDNPIYDHSVGCFLRVEPIKISLNHNATLEALSKQIQQSTIDTSNYQKTSNIIKFNAVSTLNSNNKRILSACIKLLTPLWSKLLRIPAVYRKILQHSIARLMFFKRDTHFIMNLNVRNNFITDPIKSANLFGLKQKPIKQDFSDLLAIDYVFEACFLFNNSQKQHYLVISANLQPEFREKIAKEVIRIIDATLTDNKKITNSQYDSSLSFES
ncbi:MAG: amino acid adenylation domain-containing protein [Legionella sp.]|uniref:non-ribosomal peptide synthetase n=1 Tax=Legionella sp. TaxID=459 RepID=UPI0039E61081